MFSLSLHSSIPKLPLPWSRSLLIPSAHSYPSRNSIPPTYNPFRHFPKPPMFVFLYVLFYPLSVYSHIESSRYRLFRTQKKYIKSCIFVYLLYRIYSYLSLPFACTTTQNYELWGISRKKIATGRLTLLKTRVCGSG